MTKYAARYKKVSPTPAVPGEQFQLTTRAAVIRDMDLCRHPREKLYYGTAEILITIRAALAHSEWTARNERLVKIQFITHLVLVYYTCLRPGSCAPSCQQFAAESKASSDRFLFTPNRSPLFSI